MANTDDICPLPAISGVLIHLVPLVYDNDFLVPMAVIDYHFLRGLQDVIFASKPQKMILLRIRPIFGGEGRSLH